MCEMVPLQALVAEKGTAHLAWTNPFPDAVTVDVSLVSEPAEGPLVTLPPCHHLPLLFGPC